MPYAERNSLPSSPGFSKKKKEHVLAHYLRQARGDISTVMVLVSMLI